MFVAKHDECRAEAAQGDADRRHQQKDQQGIPNEGRQAGEDRRAQRLKSGRPRDRRDTMIAGIVLANHAALATRNVKHFEDIAKSVVNPWA